MLRTIAEQIGNIRRNVETLKNISKVNFANQQNVIVTEIGYFSDITN